MVSRCAQGLRVGLGQRQFGLADQARQRRAQLVRGIVQKALFLPQAASHRAQQLVQRGGQRVHFLRGLGQLDRRQVRQRLFAPVAQLRLQAGQGLQAA